MVKSNRFMTKRNFYLILNDSVIIIFFNTMVCLKVFIPIFLGKMIDYKVIILNISMLLLYGILSFYFFRNNKISIILLSIIVTLYGIWILVVGLFLTPMNALQVKVFSLLMGGYLLIGGIKIVSTRNKNRLWT